MLIVLGIILFVLLVVVHELGHFLVARRNGVEVEEYGIGFPPEAFMIPSKIGRFSLVKRLWKDRHGTVYTLNPLPLGGFVRLKGETDEDDREGSFGAASLWAKAKITMAGVVVNFFAAWVILTILAFIGIPRFIIGQFDVPSNATTVRDDVVVGFVEESSPAAAAGVDVNDELVSLGGVPIEDAEELRDITRRFAGQTVPLVIEEDGEVRTAEVTLNEEDNEQGVLGVVPAQLVEQRYTWAAPIVGLGTTVQTTVLTLQGLASLVGSLATGDTEAATEQVGGPIAVVSLLTDTSEIGLPYLLFFIAIISITLAVMNALPIPALDGGRLAVLLLFRAIRKPLTARTEQLIHGTGFAVLMVLVVLISTVDVQRYF